MAEVDTGIEYSLSKIRNDAAALDVLGPWMGFAGGDWRVLLPEGVL